MKLETKSGLPTSYAMACGYSQVTVDHMGGQFQITRYPAMRAYRLVGQDWTGERYDESFPTLAEARKRLAKVTA